LRLKGIQLAVILIENRREGKIKMSFRSKGEFPAHTFAETFFRGGGHKNAAGGVSFDTMETTQDRLVAAIQEWKNHFE
ncbi:MAG TPA: DHH family phosphoesterase, partial [Flavobacteriaceae bacterium]|nr:DHH family phosphoesterase [Flavobacteriaceae bacterium]